ncbi:MAG: peptide chain release factor N(5)-glutamine methyltransferase [Bombilactobacillus mellifer]|uniref:peptide chain release factor N(5)-glutamine methyltransferase n=1 Tax=Bombilactobacillus mellifer TaxID=1218492 RepID=UPI0023F84158|nr:peptide chain release factor N(5)-glutamine methyltransferase [Bombilactobacillus mellifer]MCT6893795.1 peptide chain release factor N(5)-glutamine methyltransferase [Bombilactobacillus mellifer]
MVKLSYTDALQRAFLMLKNTQQPLDTARYLLWEMLHWTATQFSLHGHELMSPAQQEQYFAYIKQAQTGCPPQYILGQAWFYGHQFQVNAATLIPRQDSESMIAQILADDVNDQSVLELGTGSGALIITLALKAQWQKIIATDISSSALRVAQNNIDKYQVPVQLRQGDLWAPVRGDKFDVILFNPPYISAQEIQYMDRSVIEYEPHQALFADADGLEFYQRIFADFASFLNPGGRLYLEFGFHQQAQISKLFAKQQADWQLDFFQDLAGQPRFLRIQRKEVK